MTNGPKTWADEPTSDVDLAGATAKTIAELRKGMQMEDASESHSQSLNYYEVYDHDADTWMQPFPMAADGLAQREIAMAAKQPGHVFHMFPDRFTLFRIGEWDNRSGGIQMLIERVRLGNVTEICAAFASKEMI